MDKSLLSPADVDHEHTSATGGSGQSPRGRGWRNVAAFWCLGLLNNTTYVVMNAGATEIASGGVALVYICNEGPSLAMKLTLPYWAHLMGYRLRVVLAGACMSMSLALVAFGKSLGVQLLGVAFSSMQSGLGESSMLGLTSKYSPHTSAMLTAWSSGTGFAGVFGYAWNIYFHRTMGLSFGASLMIGNSLVFLWFLAYFVLLTPPPEPQGSGVELSTVSVSTDSGSDRINVDLSPRRRFRIVVGLWRYTVPLFIVYFAEYAMQSGAWTVIGFPINDADARTEFYTYANWSYQAGVFVSRSSGMFVQAGLGMLWVLPLLQAFFLAFFVADALWLFWWGWGLLAPCFVTGLLGGTVYVNALMLVGQSHREGPVRELALTAASVGGSLGILSSDVAGLFIQGCLFRFHHLPGAEVQC